MGANRNLALSPSVNEKLRHVPACGDILTRFLRDTYFDIYTSRHIVGGAAILDPLVTSYFAEHLRPDYEDADLERLATQLRSIRAPLKKGYYRVDFLKRQFETILGDGVPLSIEDCKTESAMSHRYFDISRNFMGFLHEQKGWDWMAAEFYRSRLFEYCMSVIPEGKRPKEPFLFSEKLLDTGIGKTSRGLMWPKPYLVASSFNAIHWFAEFLERKGTISEEGRNEIQGRCRSLYDRIFPGMLTFSYNAWLFRTFPLA